MTLHPGLISRQSSAMLFAALVLHAARAHMRGMIEINWGKPLTIVTQEGDAVKISTIEQAKYWLRKRWPVTDDARHSAVNAIQSAMECMLPVQAARHAFVLAAQSAGFGLDHRAA